MRRSVGQFEDRSVVVVAAGGVSPKRCRWIKPEAGARGGSGLPSKALMMV